MKRIFSAILLFITSINTFAIQKNETVDTRKIIVLSKHNYMQQLTQKNTIYIVRKRIDLKGDAITMPDGSTLLFKKGYVKGGKIYNLQNSEVTAKNFCLKKGDDISSVWGDGWKNMKIDFHNIPLVQSGDIIIKSGDYFELKGLNENRQNNSKLFFYNIPRLHISDCVIDGSSSTSYKITRIYDSYCGLLFQNCPNAIIENNTVQNMVAFAGICVPENCNGIIIRNNKIRNVTNVPDAKDTNGDGIYVRISKDITIEGNTVSIDDGLQIGRGGIVSENGVSGIRIMNNTVEGYDRGIHIEHVHDGDTNWVSNNHVTRCVSPMLLWNCGSHPMYIENNYFSTEGCSETNMNTPLTYGRGVFSYLGKYEEIIGDYNGGTNASNTLFRGNQVICNAQFKPSWGSTYMAFFESGNMPQLYNNTFVHVNGDSSQWRPFQNNQSPAADKYREVVMVNNTIEASKYCVYGYSKALIERNNITFTKLFTPMFFFNISLTEKHDPSDIIIQDNNFNFIGNEIERGGTGYDVISRMCAIIRNNHIPAFSLPLFGSIISENAVFDGNTIVRSISGQLDYSKSSLFATKHDTTKMHEGTNTYIDKVNNKTLKLKNKETARK